MDLLIPASRSPGQELACLLIGPDGETRVLDGSYQIIQLELACDGCLVGLKIGVSGSDARFLLEQFL
jgi:hypothetical protein